MKNKKNTNFLKALFACLLMCAFAPVSAQENPGKAERKAKQYMQRAEEAVAENNFASAEALYRMAIAKDPNNTTARYNLGNLYYKNGIIPEAVEKHSEAANIASEKQIKHKSFHNKGNAFMKEKQYEKAIEAYKNSLRNEPDDDETRYNLALAKKMLEKQKKEGGGKDNKKQDQNQDQKKDQKNKNQDQQGENEKKDQGDKKEQKEGGDKENKDQQEGEEKKDENGKPKDEQQQDQKKPGEGEKQKEKQPQQPVPGQLSQQQIKNLLEAMSNQEKKVQEKMNAEKAKGVPVPTAKNW